MITIKNTAVQNKSQPTFLSPFSSDTAPFNKNTATKSVSIISKAILDCKVVEVELFISTQIAGNIASPEITITINFKYLVPIELI